jgi:segregation and condensation protein B
VTGRSAAILTLRGASPERLAHEAALRLVEAMLFASPDPLGASELAARLPSSADLAAVLDDLERHYRGRGSTSFSLAASGPSGRRPDLSPGLAREPEPQKLSRAALEILAIIAYHQPATRAEIEEIRGVATSKGTLDTLLETGWVRMRGRRKAPGRPITYGTSAAFLDHFGLNEIADLPGLDELTGLGLVQVRSGPKLDIPSPTDDAGLADDEEPLEGDLSLSPTPVCEDR